MLVGFLPDSMQAKAQTILSACAGEGNEFNFLLIYFHKIGKKNLNESTNFPHLIHS